MTSVQAVTEVMEWLRERVCPRVTLKVPPDPREPDTTPYEYRTAHPEVFGMYWPVGPENCAPGVEFTHPGMLVSIQDGEDAVGGLESTFRLRVHCGAWNPGRHAEDTWTPDNPELRLPDGTTTAEYGPYVRDEGGEFVPVFEDGWRDVWNFVDTLRDALRSTRSIGHLELDAETPVTFSPYKEGDAAINTYPYWFAYVDFSVRSSASGDPTLAQYL